MASNSSEVIQQLFHKKMDEGDMVGVLDLVREKGTEFIDKAFINKQHKTEEGRGMIWAVLTVISPEEQIKFIHRYLGYGFKLQKQDLEVISDGAEDVDFFDELKLEILNMAKQDSTIFTADVSPSGKFKIEDVAKILRTNRITPHSMMIRYLRQLVDNKVLPKEVLVDKLVDKFDRVGMHEIYFKYIYPQDKSPKDNSKAFKILDELIKRGLSLNHGNMDTSLWGLALTEEVTSPPSALLGKLMTIYQGIDFNASESARLFPTTTLFVGALGIYAAEDLKGLEMTPDKAKNALKKFQILLDRGVNFNLSTLVYNNTDINQLNNITLGKGYQELKELWGKSPYFDPSFGARLDRVKKMGHVAGLSGNMQFPVKGAQQAVTLSYEGLRTEIFSNSKSVDWLREAFDSYSGLANNPSLQAYYQGLKNINLGTAEAKAIFKQNKVPLIYHTGWSGHSITLVIYRGHLIVTNRGEHGDSLLGTKIYELPSSIGEEAIGNLHGHLHRLEGATDRDAFVEGLKVYGLDLGVEHKYALNQKAQEHGNCSFANLKSSVEGVLFVDHLSQIGNVLLSKEQAKADYKLFSTHIRQANINRQIESIESKAEPIVQDTEAAVLSDYIHHHHNAVLKRNISIKLSEPHLSRIYTLALTKLYMGNREELQKWLKMMPEEQSNRLLESAITRPHILKFSPNMDILPLFKTQYRQQETQFKLLREKFMNIAKQLIVKLEARLAKSDQNKPLKMLVSQYMQFDKLTQGRALSKAEYKAFAKLFEKICTELTALKLSLGAEFKDQKADIMFKPKPGPTPSPFVAPSPPQEPEVQGPRWHVEAEEEEKDPLTKRYVKPDQAYAFLTTNPDAIIQEGVEAAKLLHMHRRADSFITPLKFNSNLIKKYVQLMCNNAEAAEVVLGSAALGNPASGIFSLDDLLKVIKHHTTNSAFMKNLPNLLIASQVMKDSSFIERLKTQVNDPGFNAQLEEVAKANYKMRY